MIARLLLALFLTLMTSPAQSGFEYVWGDYVITRSAANVTKISHKDYGTWTGDAIAMNRPLDIVAVKHELRFEFETPNYFGENNKGHFAVAVMANRGPAELVGRGLVIGNVAGYGKRTTGCAMSVRGDRIVIETFWKGGNCVWGEVSSSVRLHNNERYRLTLQAARSAAGEQGKLVSYRLEQKIGQQWKEVHQTGIFDPINIPIFNGWFILEVFSDGPWEMRLFNVTETVE